MTHLTTLKNLLYDILTLGNDDSDTQDIYLSQQMGLNMTKAISKDGVHLVQIQSIIDRKVAYNIVAALRLIDSMPDDGIAGEIKAMAAKQIPLEKFQEQMKALYVAEVLKQSESGAEAARKLGVQRTYLCRLKKELQVE